MIHRLALLLGGAGAAGVLALAFAMGGSGSPPAQAADAFVPVGNDLPTPQSDLPTPQSADTTGGLGAGTTDEPKKDVQTVYVLPTPHAPTVHRGGGTANDPQPTDKPHHPRDNNGGGQAGNEPPDDQTGDNSGSDDPAQNDSDDQAGGGDQHDGGGHDDGSEPGDD